MSEPDLITSQTWKERWAPNNEWVLILIILMEVAFFGAVGDNFMTTGNFFEITRLAVSYGLVALGMTLVIKTSGIDLSAGSIMAIVAVMTGVLWQVMGLNIWVASSLGIAIGVGRGAFNGYLITRLNVPPLIVTLGTMSLFRGVADSITHGYTTYTGFDPGFLNLGQGYIGGLIPSQLPIFVVAFVVLWFLMHRMRFGRYVTTIGFGAEGARYAGVDTQRVLRRVYMISGLMAGMAAIIFMAKNGQAKSDAGTGYELLGITMAVLGGTSTSGGKGTLHGTALGLLVIVILQNGLRLCGQSADIANMLIGIILIGAILIDRFSRSQTTTTTK